MSHPLWDIPTRVFHWSIVCLVPLAWWSAETQSFDLHQYVGYSVIILVITRICWGFMGSMHSRFSDFIVGPHKILASLRGDSAQRAGHTPLGGWSIIILLLLLLLQAVSGLFNSDDILYSGPLYYAAPDDLRGVMGEIHDWAFNGLLAFIALHIAAVSYYQLRKKQPLIRAMVLGKAPAKEGGVAPVAWWKAVLLVGLCAMLMLWGLEQAPQPDPTPWY